MNDYKLKLCGKLYSLESCYPFQVFEVDDKKLYLQSSGRFGVKTANYTIENPAMYLQIGNVYYRFDIEMLTIVTNENGDIEIGVDLRKSLVKNAIEIIGKL